jgi:hypothetical protein
VVIARVVRHRRLETGDRVLGHSGRVERTSHGGEQALGLLFCCAPVGD